jgi:hypothetical protein
VDPPEPQEKNRLRAFDAAQVKAVFGAKLAQLTALWAVAAEAQGIAAIKWPAFPDPEEDLSSNESRNSSHKKAVDKSVLTLPEPRRVRNRDHVR